ncbi:diaminobutyrate--2-oxoglutarate transaminase [Bradyrhizobium sp. Pha-3]|uniref:diaminobutyrate--2-oxoglutarate transaminase n=1 Tax=Bradyrhizobium sp. Pha-3 TaxID=208375 RepID=UPI0035D4A455
MNLAFDTGPTLAPDARRRHETLFAQHESEVRYYCRRLPRLLSSARGSVITDSEGATFVDFLSACGSLNYGHNHPVLKQAAIDYLLEDGIAAGLDFHTEAKLAFIEAFENRILSPRGLRYRMQFPGPTGASCVEAALKLARKATGRSNVVAFTNAFHGVSTGALAVTGSATARKSAQGTLGHVTRIPYDGYLGSNASDIARFEAMAADPSGGIDPVAAVIVECVQGEGGLNVASDGWLQAVAGMTRRLGALLIVDDIQAGCGRTGTFFSFERSGIVPDLVCLAKSIGGYGLPMSLLLIAPERDVWLPGEHNGTFRGNSLAFVTACAAIGLWDDAFSEGIQERSETLRRWCADRESELADLAFRKGTGLMQGLEFSRPSQASIAADRAAAAGIIIECCGPRDEVLKIMPPLNIEMPLFVATLDKLAAIVRSVASEDKASSPWIRAGKRGARVSGS